MKGAVRQWMWMMKRGYSRNGRDVSGNKTNEKLTKTVKGKQIASINKRWGGANTTVSNQRRNTSIDMDHPASTNICIPWHQVITAAIILPDPTIIIIYGTKPVALPKASEKTNSPVANDHVNQLYKSREEALAAHDLA